MDNCSLCTKKFLHCSRKVTCQLCALSFHMNCITLSQDHRKYIEDNIDIWYCSSCTSCIFPFNNIEEDIHFMAAIKEMSANCEMSLCYLSDKIFVPFELNDKDHSFFSDTDPDLHYYNSLSQLTYKCNYYLESSFNEDIRNHGLSSNVFSLCHVNIRSISKNLGSFENYLNLLDHHFTFVGITETWLKDSNCDLFGLTGYNMIESHRGTQGGGGVSIYVRDHWAAWFKPVW